MTEQKKIEITWNSDYSQGYVETDDPRIVAVIERSEDESVRDLFDGDGINPIIYVNHSFGTLKFSHEAGFDGGEAELMQRAYEEWGWNRTARRYLWIFHGIYAANANNEYDRSGNWIVATSHAFADHVGLDHPKTTEEATELCKGIADDLSKFVADGEVYGIGYAINENHVLPDGPGYNFDESGEWTVDLESWGYIGSQHAIREALSVAKYVNLPDMLTLPVEMDHSDYRAEMMIREDEAGE